MRRLLLCAALLACQRPADRPPARIDLTAAIGAAERAAIGDLDGDGRNEIAVADAVRLRVLDRSGRELASIPAPGGIQVLVAADLDRDGRAELVAGWGRTRARTDAAARVAIYRLEGAALGEELVSAPETERPQIAALVPRPPDLLVAWYASQYLVASALARPGPSGWTLEPIAEIRTAASYAMGDLDRDGTADLVVGRFYGDQVGADGDAFILRPDGSRLAIPTTRGVQALALADGDRDGHLDLFLADGWHKQYGARARALLTWSRWTGAGFRSELIDEIEGEYTIWSLLAADLDGDGHPEIAARGAGSVRVYRWDGGAWKGSRVAGQVEDIAAGDLDGAPGAELLVVGARSEWIRLGGR